MAEHKPNQKQRRDDYNEGYSRGHEEGYKSGFEDGLVEAQRLLNKKLEQVRALVEAEAQR